MGERERHEEELVRTLGETIGFGRLMQLGEKIWRERAIAGGLKGSEHTTGPCAAFMEPCQCASERAPVLDANGHCDWCCGARRVTNHVRAVQRRLTTTDDATSTVATVGIKVLHCWNARYRTREAIRVVLDGELVATGSYGGEPEDNSETRDYAWVKEAIAEIAKRLGASVSVEDIEIENESDFDQAAFGAGEQR